MKRIKKIVFVETKSAYLHVYSHVPFPRIGSVLLGTILRNRGYDASVYIEELGAVDMQDFLSADLVGLSALTSTVPRAYELARLARRAGIPVVMGGTHVTFLPDEGLDEADYLVRGEGEETIVELLEALEGDRDRSAIRGLSYWADGEKVHNQDRPLKTNLDDNPIADYSLLRGGGKRIKVASIMTARGCPFDCSFCSVPTFNGKGSRAHSVDRVLEEIAFNVRRQGIDYLFFADDIFNVNRKRMKEILTGMIDHKLTPRWGAQVRHELSRDPELLELMKRANCGRAFVGFESINQQTLDLFNKHETVENIEHAIRAFHQHGIKIHGMFVLGSDEDSVETIRQTQDFARRWDIDSIQFMILTPIPGSRDYGAFVRQGREFLSNHWGHFDGHHAVHRPAGITPYELQTETIGAMRRFYSWGSIFNRLARRDFYDAGLKFTAKRLLRSWSKSIQEQEYVTSLKEQLYEESKQLVGAATGSLKQVAVTELARSTPLGRAMETFFAELGIKVLYQRMTGTARRENEPEHAVRRAESTEARRAESLAHALHALRDRVDLLILPIKEDWEKVKEHLLPQLTRHLGKLDAQRFTLPNIVQVDLNSTSQALRQLLTKLGLLYTDDLERIRAACHKALASA